MNTDFIYNFVKSSFLCLSERKKLKTKPCLDIFSSLVDDIFDDILVDDIFTSK